MHDLRPAARGKILIWVCCAFISLPGYSTFCYNPTCTSTGLMRRLSIDKHLNYWLGTATSHGVHPKWSTPSAVVYTQSGLHHEAWFTPSAVVHTKSGLHHKAWSTPPPVVYTQSGLHHEAWFVSFVKSSPASHVSRISYDAAARFRQL